MMNEQQSAAAERIRGYMKKEAYADAVNAFADMAGADEAPEECFGDIARAYFELGDYERAANWVTTTLTREPQDIDVRILLGRICQREKRAEDALAVYDKLLEVHGRTMTEAQRAEIQQRAGLDARLNPTKTRTDYPHLAALLGLGEAPVSVPVQSAVKKPAVPAPKAVALPGEKALAVNASETAAKILGQNIRPGEKLRALNAFAGAAYMAGDYEGAKVLLTEALRLDSGCDETIKNMAVLLHDIGDTERAIRVASEMKHTDFLLLRTLKS